MAETKGPPTLNVPKSKAAKKDEVKATLAKLKEKARAARPAAKLTYGMTVNGKFVFTKQEFSSAADAMAQATKTYNKFYGKGLRELIVSIHK